MFIFMLVTFLITVTLQVAVLLPSTVLQVIVTVPLPTAVILPDELTVATFLLLDDHFTLWLLALEGLTVALRV